MKEDKRRIIITDWLWLIISGSDLEVVGIRDEQFLFESLYMRSILAGYVRRMTNQNQYSADNCKHVLKYNDISTITKGAK